MNVANDNSKPWGIYDNGGVGGYHPRGFLGRRAYGSWKAAARAADRLNLEYGAHRFRAKLFG